MNIKNFLSVFFLTVTVSLGCAQEQVYVIAGMEGQGYLRARADKCYVITPYHVIKNSAGSLDIIGTKGLTASAKVVKEYIIADLALLELLDGKLECSKWLEMTNFALMLETQTEGHFSFREKDGSLSPTAVNFVNVQDDYIDITPAENEAKFHEGMSGGILLVNGAPSGVLLSVDTLGMGHVIRKDAIMRITQPFFDIEKKKEDLSRANKNALAKNIFRYYFGYYNSPFRIHINPLYMKTNSDVQTIFYGYASNKLNKTIAIAEAFKHSTKPMYNIPIMPGAESLWYQLKFSDGTSSDIISHNFEKDQFFGIELEGNKNGSPALYLACNYRSYPELFIQWEVPFNVEAALYSFEKDEGMFRIDKPYTKNSQKVDIDTEYLKLAFELNDGTKIGPFEYNIADGELLLRKAFKQKFSGMWNNINCYKIPKAVNAETNSEVKNEDVLTLKDMKYKLSRKGLRNVENGPAVQCYFDGNVLGGNYFPAIKEIRYGQSHNRLEKKIPVQIGLRETLKGSISKNEQRNVLRERIDGDVNEVYFQVIYFDDSSSEIRRIPIIDLFKK